MCYVKAVCCTDLFHKWRVLHENEACMLFSQSILVSNYQTDMISFLAFFLLSIRVSFRVRIWIILLFSDFSKDKTKTCHFGSWKQELTD